MIGKSYFKNENFVLNKNVSFMINTIKLNKHKYCDLNSLKIRYFENLIDFKDQDLSNHILINSFKNIKFINLINYISWLINNEIVFDIYDSPIKTFENKFLNLNDRITFMICFTKFILINPTYKNGIINENNEIICDIEKYKNKSISDNCKYLINYIPKNQIYLIHFSLLIQSLILYEKFEKINEYTIFTSMITNVENVIQIENFYEIHEFSKNYLLNRKQLIIIYFSSKNNKFHVLKGLKNDKSSILLENKFDIINDEIIYEIETFGISYFTDTIKRFLEDSKIMNKQKLIKKIDMYFNPISYVLNKLNDIITDLHYKLFTKIKSFVESNIDN